MRIFPELKMNNVQKKGVISWKYQRVLLFLAGESSGQAAGFNDASNWGIFAYPPYLSVLNFLLSLVVVLHFWQFVFGELVKTHSQNPQLSWHSPLFPKILLTEKPSLSWLYRITSVDYPSPVRHCSGTSLSFVFYSGLGSSLFLAGILFWFNVVKPHTPLLKAQQEKSNSLNQKGWILCEQLQKPYFTSSIWPLVITVGIQMILKSHGKQTV